MKTGRKKKESLLDQWLNREQNEHSKTGIMPRPKGVQIPLSQGQQRLLFLQKLNPENPFYNYADAYRFRGNLNVDHLIRSFELAAERHEILRTGFQIEDGQAIQTIYPEAPFQISKFDLRELPNETRFPEAKRIVIEQAQTVFDLSSGSLLRISVIRLENEDFLIGLVMHHIIGDEGSLKVLLEEIANTYRKLQCGENGNVASLAIQYADYAFWQNNQEIVEANFSYWTTKLENTIDLLDLPTDSPRPLRPTFKGRFSNRVYSEKLSTKLKTLCKETNSTPYVLFLTAYSILLHRYSGETDILIGSPVSNRDKIELEKLLGFFNDTLVLRSDLSENPTFMEIFQQVRENVQEAFAHKNMPLETLVKALKPERYLNYNPLFQTMFIFQHGWQLPSFGEDVTFAREEFDFGITKFDLTLTISEDSENETRAKFEYAKDLFEEETIERLSGNFETLLKGIAKNPHSRISDLPLVTDAEHKLFEQWNNTNTEETEVKSVTDLFERQVKQTPENTAISFRGETLTYAELNQRANWVASYLLDLELDRDEPVGLFVEAAPEMIVGILGILKAGLAYLPLDAEYPDERIEFILKDSRSSIVLTQECLYDKIARQKIKAKTFDAIFTIKDLPETKSQKTFGENDLAYVIYTSGSSGKPKGVAVTNKNLAYSNWARFEYYPTRPNSFLLLSSFSFDSSIVGIFWTLTSGGKLILTERRSEQDINFLSKTIEVEKVTHVLLLPTLYSILLQNISDKLSTLEAVIVAGEECPASLTDEHFRKTSKTRLYNEYGPTEATVWATVYEIMADDENARMPIGKAIPNTQIYILDKDQNRVPIGVWGEIYIGGMGVAKGYFNAPDLTQERFLENRFNSKDNDRLYRSGDLGRFRQDGTIEFAGRIDEQVKVRGYRIEFGEIRAAIQRILRVQEVFLKMEYNQPNKVGILESDSDDLSKHLEKMNVDEAELALRSVEQLSDKEIEFILNEQEKL